MGCFFGCFRANDKQDFPPPNSPHVVVDSAPVRKAKVSQNPLSDLLKSQEIEELSCHGKTIPPEIVDIQFHDEKTHMEVETGKQPVQPWSPVKLSVLEKGSDSFEETPTSCISDPPTSGRISISTTEKNTSTALVSSSFPDAHASHNWNAFDEPGYQRCSLQSHNNKPTSLPEDLKVQGSLSSWLKPVQNNKPVNKNFQDELGVGRNRTSADRPILGTVATYWNEEVESSAIPLKWWDGNGIPNSTNKYREDQKVSWHVTPFEERLEKALSEENSISQSRKHISGVHTDFEDEIDTAASRLQSLPHPKSVVSF
ncbi:unnamed protein product [Rhodiola kirilowii]